MIWGIFLFSLIWDIYLCNSELNKSSNQTSENLGV